VEVFGKKQILLLWLSSSLRYCISLLSKYFPRTTISVTHKLLSSRTVT
jgi:hypothetical protein